MSFKKVMNWALAALVFMSFVGATFAAAEGNGGQPTTRASGETGEKASVDCGGQNGRSAKGVTAGTGGTDKKEATSIAPR